jgi:hypothetical protein
MIAGTAGRHVPEHLHLLIWPLPEANTIDVLLKAIKRPFSCRIKQANSPT